MKRLIITSLCLVATTLVASIVIIFDTNTGQIIRRIDSADTLAYIGQSNALINPIIPTNTYDWLYVTNGVISTWTAQQYLSRSNSAWIANSNATWVANFLERSNRIYNAKTFVMSDTTEGYVIRGMLYSLLARVNMLSTNPTTAFSNVTTQQMWLSISNAIANDPL